MVNHEGNAVDVGADGKRKLSVAFHVVAAVPRTTPDKLSRRALRRRGARLSRPRHRRRECAEARRPFRLGLAVAYGREAPRWGPIVGADAAAAAAPTAVVGGAARRDEGGRARRAPAAGRVTREEHPARLIHV